MRYFPITVLFLLSTVNTFASAASVPPKKTIDVSASTPYYPKPIFVKPDDFAQKCLNGTNDLVTKCQKEAMENFSPEKQHTEVTTLWESCCTLYEEVFCYEANADIWCSPVIAFQVKIYAREVYQKVERGMCRNIYWDQFCKDHGDIPIDHNKNHSFIHLPTANKEEEKCINKLQKIQADDHKDYHWNLVDKCEHQIMERLDPDFKKDWNITGAEICCGMYELIDCVGFFAEVHCDREEITGWQKYKTETLASLSSLTICKQTPYSEDQLQQCLANHQDSGGMSAGKIIALVILGLALAIVVVFIVKYVHTKNYFRFI